VKVFAFASMRDTHQFMTILLNLFLLAALIVPF